MSTSRHCYVVGCSNGDYRLLRWSHNKCPTHACFLGTENCDCEPPFRLYTFPSAKKQLKKRQLWVQLLKRSDPKNIGKLLEPGAKHRVCSQHFVDGYPSALNPHPTINLGYRRQSSCDNEEMPSAKQRKVDQTTNSADNLQEPETHTAQRTLPFASILILSGIISILLSLWRKKSSELLQTKAENVKLKRENMILQQNILKLRALTNKKLSTNILKTDYDASFFTGLDRISSFWALHKEGLAYVKRSRTSVKKIFLKGVKRLLSPRKFKPKPRLSSQDELLLTLMKLRLGLVNSDLARRFHIPVSLCNRIVNIWLTALSKSIGKTVHWYPMGHIRATVPARYQCLPNLRSVIDCSEISVQMPKYQNFQHLTWSDYKHKAKFLVSVAPNSMISFISSAYDGRLSDKKIVEMTKFLDKFDEGDMVMADKRFDIEEECLLRNIHFNVLSEKPTASQISNAADHRTECIANLRMMVQKIIHRLKTFRILNGQLPLSQLQSLDKILIVCAALCNLMPPIHWN